MRTSRRSPTLASHRPSRAATPRSRDPCGAGAAMAANAAIPARPRGQADMAGAVDAVNAVRAEPIRGDCRQIDCQSEGRPPGTKGRGDVAQLVEHLLCKQGVVGSSPIVSTENSRVP